MRRVARVQGGVPHERGHQRVGRAPKAMRPLGGVKAALPLLLLLLPSLAAIFGCFPSENAPGAERLEAQRLPEGEAPLDDRLIAAARDDGLSAAREQMERALALHAGGDTAGALVAFQAAADAGPALADWALALASDLHARSGRIEETGELVARLPGDLRDRWGWRPLARAAVRAGHPGTAVALVARALPLLDAAPDSAEALRLLAEARIALGDSAAARVAFGSAAGAAPTSIAAGAAAVRLIQLGLEGEDHHALVRYHLARGELPAARRVLDRYLRLSVGDPARRAALRLDFAEALVARGHASEAEQRLGALLTLAPDTLRSRALLLTARARMRQGKRDASLRTLEEAARLAHTHAGQEALFILADLDQDAGRNAAARERFGRILEHLPGTEWGAEAAVRLGALALLEGNLLEAASVFERYRAFHAEGWRFQQAAYWAGLVHRRLGREPLARERFEEAARSDPAHFYGIRAADEAGLGPLRGRLLSGPAEDPLLERLARGAVRRIELLEALGLEEIAAVELARVRAHLSERPGALHAFAEALHERGRLLEAVRFGRWIRRAQGTWDVRLLRIVHPFPYRDEILRAAERHGVSPFLMAGLIRQESLFDPTIESGAGAVGLMQLLPRTARDLAFREPGVERVDAETLRQVPVNVSLGALHLGELLRRHGSRVQDVLAEYNAGAGRLASWKRHPEYGDPALFLERIPFRETREYVRVVMENARIYEAIYAEIDWTPPVRVASAAVAER